MKEQQCLIASSQRRADFQHSCSRDQLLVRLPGLDPYLDPWSKRLSMELLPGIWVLPNSRVFSKQCGNLWDMRVFRVLLSLYAFDWFFIRVWNYSDVTFISSIARFTRCWWGKSSFLPATLPALSLGG